MIDNLRIDISKYTQIVNNTEEAFNAISLECAKRGATTIVPTVTSSTYENMKAAVKVFENVKNHASRAKLAELHFEGPYFALS